MILLCPVCGEAITDCQCGDGCAVCGGAKAVYALAVCGDCVELPEDLKILAVLRTADAFVASIEAGYIESLPPTDPLWALIRAVCAWRCQ